MEFKEKLLLRFTDLYALDSIGNWELIKLKALQIRRLLTITCQKHTDPYKMTGSLFNRIGKKSNKYS